MRRYRMKRVEFVMKLMIRSSYSMPDTPIL